MMLNPTNRLSRVLITGATGFIGQSVYLALVVANFTVRGTVRSVGKKDDGSIEYVYVGDIGPDTDWDKALESIDVIVHLAARVHVLKETAFDPLAEFRQVNVAGTEHLARMAAKAGVRRLVFGSSIGVNGRKTNEQLWRCYSEVAPPDPYNPYTISKWEAEQVLHQVAKETCLEVVILRPPLVYGPCAPGNFDRLINLVYCGTPLPLSSVNNRRAFIYVKNLASAIVACVQHPAAAGKTFLVSDGEDVSTPELIRRIARALGRPARLFPFPSSLLCLGGKVTGQAETVDRLVNSLAMDSSKIRRELGWIPPYSMEQGLKETAEWYLSRLKRSTC